MRSLYLSLSALFAAVFVFSSCSQNNIAQTEVDDMYFTSKDRKALEASSKVYTENFTQDYETPLTEAQVDDYSDINYSSKTVNPEYIAKYSSEELTEEPVFVTDDEYYDDSYNYQDQGSGQYDNFKVQNNYYGYPSYGYGNPYNRYSVWDYDPWFYTSPYRFRPNYFGSGIRVSVGFGWNYGYYNPYSYYGSRFYDPFAFRYNRWYNDPWGYYGGTYYGYSGYYCPTFYAPTYFITDNKSFASRAITRGPRVARGATINSNGNSDRQYRGTGDGVRIVDDGSVASRNNTGTNARSTTGSRNNYYRRSGTTGDNTGSTRSYQSSTRRSNPTITTNSRRTTTSGYSRPSQSSSSYRTKSSGNSSRYSSGTTRRSTSSYRSSGTSSRSSRSSSSTFRSGSSSRSSGATRSISSGSSSRSSGSSSSGSRGSRGSSSSSSRRGGN